MAEATRCPKCGVELAADAPAGLCPECLLKQGLQSHGGAVEVESAADPTSDGLHATTSPPSGFVPPEPEEIAVHFPQLEIQELLGHGGMGVVYKARQTKLDRTVALKIIKPEVANDPGFMERFGREARSLAQLNHPNIVAIHEAGEAGELCYFIMEYVDGLNLREMLDAQQVQPEEALAIVPQICEALQFAHDEGIVHRDIKPENILLDRNGRVKIADFGLAKLAAKSPEDFTLTGTHQVMGTLRYMAPEQMEGSHEVDHRADIYSLGVVFYEVLTGELPIGRFEPPSKKIQVDVRLDEVVLRALENEPDRRFQHAVEVKTEIEQISSTRPSADELLRSRGNFLTRTPLAVRLAVWAAVVLSGCFLLLLPAMDEWWPWVYDEYWELELQPQSGAYRSLNLSGERRLYFWGQAYGDPNRLISKRPWTVTAEIHVANSHSSATLVLDSFREIWALTNSARPRQYWGGEPRSEEVIELMDEAGIDIKKPGFQQEVTTLIRMLKNAANGDLPGGKSPRGIINYNNGDRIGPFIKTGGGNRGYTLRGMMGLPEDKFANQPDYDPDNEPGMLPGQVMSLCIFVMVFLAIWLSGALIMLRRHRRRGGSDVARIVEDEA